MNKGRLLMMHRLPQPNFEARTHSSTMPSLVLFVVFFCGSVAHASEIACITAGRLDGNGQWAPKFHSVRLIDASGQAISGSKKEVLKNLQALEITEPALLSACEGDQALTPADGAQAQTKSPVPAAKPGRLAVVGVGYPPLRVGGALVEVKVQVSAEQIMMLTR
jgi:hypothetical protein